MMSNTAGAASPYTYVSLLSEERKTTRRKFPYALAFSIFALCFALACLFTCLYTQGGAKSLRMASGKTMAGIPKAPPPRGQVIWSAVGYLNGTNSPYTQWNSYSMGSPAAPMGFRATSANVVPGFYLLEFYLELVFICAAGTGVPCNSSVVSDGCPRIGLFLSCVNSAAGDLPAQANFCNGKENPPAGFRSCVQPTSDGVTFLVDQEYHYITFAGNSLGGTSTVLSNNGNGNFFLDISQQSNCSVILDFGDECQTHFPSPYDWYLSGMVQFVTAAPSPVVIQY